MKTDWKDVHPYPERDVKVAIVSYPKNDIDTLACHLHINDDVCQDNDKCIPSEQLHLEVIRGGVINNTLVFLKIVILSYFLSIKVV